MPPCSPNDLITALRATPIGEMSDAQITKTRSTDSVIVTLRIPDCYRQYLHTLESAANQVGWYKARQTNNSSGCEIWYFETFEPRTVQVKTPLFHGTAKSAAAQILADGFQPQSVNETWLERTYWTPRVFYSRSLDDVFCFLESKHLKTTVLPGQHGHLTSVQLADLEVLKFHPTVEQFHQDCEMPRAVWSSAPISADRIELVPHWRAAYRASAKATPAS